jgi:hypothetical protein
MRQVLLTFGDSWPQGGELGPGRPYGDILKDIGGYDQLYNYGSAGASNEDMLYQFRQYLDEDRRTDDITTAVFFLTNPARTAHYPRFFDWGQSATTVLKQLHTHFNRPEHEVLRSTTTVITLQSWCKHYNIDDYYFAGWVRYLQWHEGVVLDKIWRQGRETAGDWFGASDHNGEHLVNVKENVYIKPNFAHPNQLGHQFIAEKLHKWISKKRS